MTTSGNNVDKFGQFTKRDDNLATPDVNLSAEELERLERVSALPQEYLGWMFECTASSGQRVRVTPT